jgi:SAM-dependent methyltransferase
MTTSFCFETLREKWQDVPGGDIKRVNTADLLLSDTDTLIKTWKNAYDKATMGDYFKVRGWYHTLYRDILKGKKVLDVGSGFGIDGVFFALNGANVTFLDIVRSNLEVLERLCTAFDLNNVNYFYMETIESLERISGPFDVIWCQGSLINAPFETMKNERQALLRLLPDGGRWIELGYPKTRWEREGCLPFDQWGEKTDGGAPWIEWYNLGKLYRAFEPTKMEVVLNFEFFNNDFIWFDLIRTG